MTKISKNTSKNIIVFYHEKCLDGFGSAYTAWKKFKNRAEYIALSYSVTGEDVLKDKKIKISDLKNKEIYFIDFCLNETEIRKVEKVAKKLVVIDHHIGKKELVESLEGSVFKDGVSGAYLASQYFFPEEKVSKFINYISIGDTWTWKNEKLEREILSYIRTLDFDFKIFSKAEKDLEDKKKFAEAKKIGALLLESASKMIDSNLEKAKLINFEKYKVYALNDNSVFTSELGHKLAEKSKDKFAIVYSLTEKGLKVRLRGAGKIDLSELAKKYNGGGHFNAAGFIIEDKEAILNFLKEIIIS